MGAIAVAGLALATASLAQAVSVQSEGVRIAVFAQIKPHKLPRTETAIGAVSVLGSLWGVIWAKTAMRTPSLCTLRA